VREREREREREDEYMCVCKREEGGESWWIKRGESK